MFRAEENENHRPHLSLPSGGEQAMHDDVRLRSDRLLIRAASHARAERYTPRTLEAIREGEERRDTHLRLNWFIRG